MTIDTFLNHTAVQAIGCALLHFFWQGALIAALLFFADLLTRRWDARLRYALTCVAMLAMPIVSGVTVAGRLSAQISQAPRRVVAASAHRTASRVLPTARTASPFAAPAGHGNSLPGWAVCLWLAGVAMLCLYSACGWTRLRSLRRRATPYAVLGVTLARLQQSLRISRPVRLYLSAAAEVPAVAGWLRPYILLPISAVTGLDETQLRAVLAHELAHIRRHDYLVNLLQAVVETLLFYHPGVWWVSRRIREERKLCCDDLAVSVCGNALVYAGALVQLEELRGTIPQAAIGATGGELLARIRRLLGEPSPSRVPLPTGAAIALTLALGATLAVHAQQTPAPKFEVVSIKPCNPRDLRDLPPNALNGRMTFTATAMHASCWGVQALIRMAYGVPMLEAGPDWIKSTRYTIDAKADAPAGQDAMRGPMLRAVLEDRMQVKTHREMRDKPVYELRVASGGFKLKPVPGDSCTPHDPADPRRPLQPREKPYCGQSSLHRNGADLTYDLRGVTVEDFAGMFLIDFDRPVVDKTGVRGKYDFHLQFSTDETSRIYRPPEGSPAPEFPPLMTVLQNIGLKLVPGKDPQEFLIINRVERPSAN